jgi:hydroxypyruvate isomerase
MPKYAANLTFLFKELPFLERFQADAGFDGVEVLFPYDDPAPQIVARMQAAGMPLALMNGPPPNYTGGPRGYGAVPGGEDRFIRDFRRILRYAGRLKPDHIHLMAGTASGPEARRTFVANLRRAAEEAPRQSLTIEPLNPKAMPDYFLNDYALAAEIIEEVGAPNVGLQYDSYHAQEITGDALGTWERHDPLCRHVQVGSAPDRGPPGPGPVDFPALFEAIRASGYAGWISGEYNPGGRTEDSLRWLPQARGARVRRSA